MGRAPTLLESVASISVGVHPILPDYASLTYIPPVFAALPDHTLRIIQSAVPFSASIDPFIAYVRYGHIPVESNTVGTLPIFPEYASPTYAQLTFPLIISANSSHTGVSYPSADPTLASPRAGPP